MVSPIELPPRDLRAMRQLMRGPAPQLLGRLYINSRLGTGTRIDEPQLQMSRDRSMARSNIGTG